MLDGKIRAFAILTYLLAELSSLKIQVKRLYLDREFFSIAVIRWLKALDIPLAMPAIRRGKQGGIKQFLKGRKSYKTTYTMSRSQDDFVTFDIWIICLPSNGGKYKKGKSGCDRYAVARHNARAPSRGQNGVEYYVVEYYVYVTYKVRTSLNHIRVLLSSTFWR